MVFYSEKRDISRFGSIVMAFFWDHCSTSSGQFLQWHSINNEENQQERVKQEE